MSESRSRKTIGHNGHEIDMDAIRANLKLTPEQRILKLKANANFILNLRTAMASAKSSGKHR